MVHCPPDAATSRTPAPATGSLVRLSNTTLEGCISVTTVAMWRPQPRSSMSNTSLAPPSRTWSPCTTGGERSGSACTVKIPVLAPVSTAIASSRSPLAPVITTVRDSATAESALQEAASARR